MTYLPRHSKAARTARRPVLRAALAVPTVLGVILTASVGVGAVAVADQWASASAHAAEQAAATVPAAAATPYTASPPEDTSGALASRTAGAQTTAPVDMTAPASALDEAIADPQANTAGPAPATTEDPGAAPTAVAAQERSEKTVAVRSPGASYVSSSSTDRPLLMFSGWKDEAGRPLGAKRTVSTAVQVRLVAESGAAQSATIYPAFTHGRSDYALPLWPFTQAMDAHTATYTLQWRESSSAEWVSVDTLLMDVRLPEATAGATLSYTNGVLVGVGWSFDRSTNISGSFKVALAVTDPNGRTNPVTVRARFCGTYFTVSAEAFEAAGVSLGAGYVVSATPGDGAAGAVSVRIAGAGEDRPTAQPTDATTAPATQPSDAATDRPTDVPSAESTTEPSAAPPDLPSVQPQPSEGAVPSGQAVTQPQASATTTADDAAPGKQPEAAPSAAAADADSNTAQANFDVLNEGIDIDPLIVQETTTSSSARAGAASASQPESRDVSAAPPAEAEDVDANARPSSAPASPVQDAGELGPDNAGSLSGTRQGTTITLIFPSAKVSEGDWVAVFVFPGATTAGWVQVDANNSVSVDISALDPGSYKIAVGNRDSELLGWAQLEIAESAGIQSSDGTGITLTVGEDLTGDGALGADGWKLVSAGLLLALGAASFFMLAIPTLRGTGTRITRR